MNKKEYEEERERAIRFNEGYNQNDDHVFYIVKYWCNGYKTENKVMGIANNIDNAIDTLRKYYNELGYKIFNYRILNEEENYKGETHIRVDYSKDGKKTCISKELYDYYAIVGANINTITYGNRYYED